MEPRKEILWRSITKDAKQLMGGQKNHFAPKPVFLPPLPPKILHHVNRPKTIWIHHPQPCNSPPPCVIDIQRPQGCPFIKVSSLFGHYAEFGGAAGGENAWYLQLEFGLFNKKSCPTVHVWPKGERIKSFIGKYTTRILKRGFPQ